MITDQPSQELTSSQAADLSSTGQSARFQALPKDEQIALLRAHKNLGHPSPERLSTLLRAQGYRAEIAQAALELKCSTCQAQQQPKLARPSSTRDEMDFNDCLDQFLRGKIPCVPHCGLGYQFQCARVFAWAGSPSEILVDAATEFNSDEFAYLVQSNNIKLTTISPEAHYQNGKAETGQY